MKCRGRILVVTYTEDIGEREGLNSQCAYWSEESISKTTAPVVSELGKRPEFCGLLILVVFRPTLSGVASGMLTFTDSAGKSPQVVNLSATAQ